MLVALEKKINSLYYPLAGRAPLPKIIMIESTNACNLKCAMCYVQQHIKKNHYLSLSDFQMIIGKFPKIRELIFCGIGEPLLNKDIFGMINAARREGVGFINLITNGKLLNEENIHKIIVSGINRIQISVHSFDVRVFSEIRNEDAFNLEELKLNISRLVSLKKKTKSTLKVCCNAVISRFNFNNLVEFVAEAKKLGVDRVEFIQMTTASGNLKDINAPLNSISKIATEARRIARKLKIELGFLSGNDYGRCYQLWDFIMIHSDGTISPCNGIFPTENIGVGNILVEPIEEIWNSPKCRELRRLVKIGELKYCRYCESGYCLGGRDLRWFKNYYIRPLRRLVKHSLFLK